MKQKMKLNYGVEWIFNDYLIAVGSLFEVHKGMI